MLVLFLFTSYPPPPSCHLSPEARSSSQVSVCFLIAGVQFLLVGKPFKPGWQQFGELFLPIKWISLFWLIFYISPMGKIYHGNINLCKVGSAAATDSFSFFAEGYCWSCLSRSHSNKWGELGHCCKGIKVIYSIPFRVPFNGLLLVAWCCVL